MRFHILDSVTNRQLFSRRRLFGELGGFAVPVVVHNVSVLPGRPSIAVQDVYPATASFGEALRGENFVSYKAGVKCNYVVRVWPKK